MESESEGGQKLVPCRDTGFLPPNPLPFCPPEQLDFKIRSSDFRQKMFELRSKNTAASPSLSRTSKERSEPTVWLAEGFEGRESAQRPGLSRSERNPSLSAASIKDIRQEDILKLEQLSYDLLNIL